MTDQHEPTVQGMHCELKGVGTVKATVSLDKVCVTIYSSVNLFDFNNYTVSQKFGSLLRLFPETVSKEEFCQDMADMLIATDNVHKCQMRLSNGDVIITYSLGAPEFDEKDGYLYLTPSVKGWWSHPNVEPIVTAIQKYYPDFSPWLLTKDKLFAILMSRSSLLN